MVLGQLDIDLQKNQIRSPHSHHIKNQLKWVRDLNVRTRTIKQKKSRSQNKESEIAS